MKVLTLFLAVKGSSGQLLSVKSDKNGETFHYIRKLITDFDNKNQMSNDVAMFRLNSFISNSKENLADLFNDIFENIPKSTPVQLYPLGTEIVGKNIREASFIIFVTDAYNFVSKME